MLKYLVLLSFFGLALGQWQFNSFSVYENMPPTKPVADVSVLFVIIIQYL